MKERVTYVNHLGVTVDLNNDGVKVNTGELNNWQFGVSSLNGYVSGFLREITEKPVAGIVFKHSSEEALQKLDEMYEVAIIDTDNDDFEEPTYGKLVIGDWYMLCWLKGAEYERTWYEEAGDFVLTLVTDEPLWTREIPQTFINREEEETTGLDYPHDYPFDYSKSVLAMTLQNESPRKCPVRITVEGPATSWQVIIDDNIYTLKLDLAQGERAVIDGRDLTVFHYDNLGNPKNAFDKIGGKFEEHSGSYIFEKVPAGESNVSLVGLDSAEIVVYEQRDQRPFVERYMV